MLVPSFYNDRQIIGVSCGDAIDETIDSVQKLIEDQVPKSRAQNRTLWIPSGLSSVLGGSGFRENDLSVCKVLLEDKLY